MKIEEFLTKKKKTIRGFAKQLGISRYSISKYIDGHKPTRKLAWIIFMATDGQVTFQDLKYDSPPPNPFKDI